MEKGKEAGEGRKQNNESVGHMSPCLLVAGCHAERGSRRLNVGPVQTYGGVTAEDKTVLSVQL